MINVIHVYIFWLLSIDVTDAQNIYQQLQVKEQTNVTNVRKLSATVSLCYMKIGPLDIVPLNVKDCNLLPLVPYEESINRNVTFVKPDSCIILTGEVNVLLRTTSPQHCSSLANTHIQDFCSSRFHIPEYYVTGIQLILEVCDKIYLSSQKETLDIDSQVVFTCIVKDRATTRFRRQTETPGEQALHRSYVHTFDDPSYPRKKAPEAAGRALSWGPAATLATPLFTRLGGENCDQAECVLGNLLADALVWYVAQRTATGWSQVALGMLPGDMIKQSLNLTFNQENPVIVDLDKAIPDDDTLTTFNISGKHLAMALEHAMANRERVGDRWPWVQVSGIVANYMSMNDPDERMRSTEVRCANCFIPSFSALDKNTRYGVVATTSLAHGIAGHNVLRDNRKDSEQVPNAGVRQIFTDYVGNNTMLFPILNVRLMKTTYVLAAPRATPSVFCLLPMTLLHTFVFVH